MVMKASVPPGCLKHCFWDVRFEELDCRRRSRFVIERVLEYGGREAVRWMLSAYPREEIVETLSRSGHLSPRSANFWASFFQVHRERIRCLQKSFRETREKFWPY